MFYNNDCLRRGSIGPSLGSSQSQSMASTNNMSLPPVTVEFGGNHRTSCALYNVGNQYSHLSLEELNAWNEDGKTLLYRAVANGAMDDVNALIAAKADVNIVNQDGRTALHEAAFRGYTECIKVLIKSGADVNSVGRDYIENQYSHFAEEEFSVWDEKGRTALHEAAVCGHTECVKELIEAGANVKAVRSDRRTALNLAAVRGHTECVKELIKAQSDVNAARRLRVTILYDTVARGRIECVKELIEAGANVNAFNAWGWTPCHSAVSCGQVECIEALIKGGADVNAAAKDGRTPLHISAVRGHINVVGSRSARCMKELIEAGANLNAVCQGDTPLDLAALDRNFKAIEILLLNGAQMSENRINHHGLDPEIKAFLLQASKSFFEQALIA